VTVKPRELDRKLHLGALFDGRRGGRGERDRRRRDRERRRSRGFEERQVLGGRGVGRIGGELVSHGLQIGRGFGLGRRVDGDFFGRRFRFERRFVLRFRVGKGLDGGRLGIDGRFGLGG